MKLFTLMMGFAAIALATPGDHHKQIAIPAEFEAMKKLVGDWEGKTKMGDKEQDVTVSYQVTSGGTALTETLGKGSPHEMISIYHVAGKGVGMTHFCAIGNQPHMTMKSGKDGKFVFEGPHGKPIGVVNKDDNHMHSVTLTLQDPNTLVQEWTNWEKGKPAGTAVFTFKRKS